MSFWKRNANEAAYVQGKKHWTDVLKNSGGPDLLLWRQPEEDFNTNSTLVVMPGESALFVHNGQIQQEFTEGTYKLTTENYPFISRLRNQFSGGVSTFNCVVYYVRKAHTKEISWGLAPAIQVRDPVHSIMCKLRTNGAYKISIADSSKFLMYMIGSKKTAVAEEDLQEYFSSEMQMHIRTLITQFIKSSKEEILGICEYLVEISILIAPFIMNAIEKYGLNLENFSIATMDIPDDDPNRHTMETAFAQRASMKVLGEDWARIQAADILKTLAGNPGAGGVASMGAGIGMGMAAAPIFANLSQQMFGQLAPQQQVAPATPPLAFGATFGLANSNNVSAPLAQNNPPANPFASTTQEPAQPQTQVTDVNDWEQSMSKLKYLFTNGMITKEIYEAKLKDILDRM